MNITTHRECQVDIATRPYSNTIQVDEAAAVLKDLSHPVRYDATQTHRPLHVQRLVLRIRGMVYLCFLIYHWQSAEALSFLN